MVDGDMVHVSGTTGYDYGSMRMPADVERQTANALATVAGVLEEAGAGLEDVVRVRYYLADRADRDAVARAAGAVFSGIRPAATMVVAGLIEPEMKIEIEVTARIGARNS